MLAYTAKVSFHYNYLTALVGAVVISWKPQSPKSSWTFSVCNTNTMQQNNGRHRSCDTHYALSVTCPQNPKRRNTRFTDSSKKKLSGENISNGGSNSCKGVPVLMQPVTPTWVNQWLLTASWRRIFGPLSMLSAQVKQVLKKWLGNHS